MAQRSTPIVSFIIPTRNRRDLLDQTLRSIQTQTDPRWEAIVVDDHSNDETPAHVASLAAEDARIRLLNPPRSRSGAPAARNLGFTASEGTYVVFLDSDDILEAKAAARRIAAMEARPDLDFVLSAARCFVETPGDTQCLWNQEIPDWTPGTDLDRFLARDIPWQTTSPTWTRPALERLGGWNEAAPSGQDLDFHIRAIVTGLEYDRLSGYDFHWRIGRPGRASIGAKAINADHWRFRGELAEQFLRLLESHGLLNARRRILLGGEMWVAADNLRQRAGVREATRVWDRARTLKLVSNRQWLEGLAYLVGYGQRQVREPVAQYLRSAWPSELLHEPSPTHTRAPIDQERVDQTGSESQDNSMSAR